jgi:hypothetical protein
MLLTGMKPVLLPSDSVSLRLVSAALLLGQPEQVRRAWPGSIGLLISLMRIAVHLQGHIVGRCLHLRDGAYQHQRRNSGRTLLCLCTRQPRLAVLLSTARTGRLARYACLGACGSLGSSHMSRGSGMSGQSACFHGRASVSLYRGQWLCLGSYVLSRSAQALKAATASFLCGNILLNCTRMKCGARSRS